MRRRSVIRDTIQMTLLEFVLECSALLLNAWLTRFAGTEAVGTLALAGSFFNLATMIACGNAMLCASRFVSEELGRANSNPSRILTYGLTMALLLTIPVSLFCFLFASPLSRQFLSCEDSTAAIRGMALLLPFCSVAACLKGYFNAMCRVWVTAICDLLAFFLRSGVLIALLRFLPKSGTDTLCLNLVYSTAVGTIFSAGFLGLYYWLQEEHYHGACSIRFRQYLCLALPIAFGGCLTAALGTINDMLIPKTLQQYGDSSSQALAQFGVFEGVVMPVLFFPSTILCALSGILIPEIARANAAGNYARVQHLTKKSLSLTLGFALVFAVLLLVFGGCIGRWMGAGKEAGAMIRMLAPVVPFIYLEIVSEAILKGMGKQHFSSLNYLVEYVMRISIVLICIPLFGFTGVVLSYYASNVIGNCSRLCMVKKAIEKTR